jgi:hypothetical protein
MATAQDVYDALCYDVLEDGGLVLGILTLPQFFDLLNLSLLDFFTRGELFKRIYTQSILAGQAVYSIPDDILTIEDVFVGGKWLPRATQAELNDKLRGWRRKPGPPQYFYEDGLPIKSIGLAPTPDQNSETIIGVDFPDAPFAIYDSFSATVSTISGPVLQNPAQHRGLSIVGVQSSFTTVSALTDPLPLIPDEFALAYLIFSVEQRIFESDNELKNAQAALYAGAQWREGLGVCEAINARDLP